MPSDTMDAPDLQVREATIRAKLGQPLTPYDVRRLANRQSLEAQRGVGLTRTTPRGDPRTNYGRLSTPRTDGAAPTTGLARTPPAQTPPVTSTTIFGRYNGVNTAGLPKSPPALAPAMKPALPPAMPAPLSAALPVRGAPVAGATTQNAQQTESANPLSGDGNAQPSGSTAAIRPGAALGIVQRGSSVPRGQDAQPGQHAGGTGLYRRNFATPQSASIYDNYVRKLFADSGSTAGSGASDEDDEP